MMGPLRLESRATEKGKGAEEREHGRIATAQVSGYVLMQGDRVWESALSERVKEKAIT